MEPSELKKVFLFLGFLLVLLLGSFFVGMYLGTETVEDEPVASPPPDNIPGIPTPSVDQRTQEGKPQDASNVVILPAEEPAGQSDPLSEEIQTRSEPVPEIPQEKPEVESREKPKEKMVATAPTTLAKPANSPATGFTVQVGAFKDLKKAGNILSALRKKGYEISVTEVRAKEGGSIHKVRVGRFKKHEDAEVFAAKLKKDLKLQSDPFVTPR